MAQSENSKQLAENSKASVKCKELSGEKKSSNFRG